MKKLFIHNPFFRILTPPVYGIVVYLIILLVNNNVEQITTLISNQEVYVSMALSLIAFESMRLTIILLERVGIPERRKMVLQWLSTTVVAEVMVLLAISQYYTWVIGFDISLRELGLFGVIFALTALLYNALYLGNRYILYENTQLIEQEQKLREKLEAEFTTFRREINPNLLYDSLEDLILCMHTQADLAEELIDSLAALYRYQLVNRHREFVSLAEELQAVKHLLRLIHARHPRQLIWKVTIPDPESLQVLQGSLLTTLDSIVRNTLISEQAPLVITLSTEEDEDYLVLTHGLNDKLLLHPESQTAFQQLQRSYSIYSDKPFIQVKAGRENYVKFPLITIQQSAIASA
ncbi:MAG: histidine kinase [Cyclobacteriaceae bacterium]|nr:histidine kinase [Cyclobacteriaceae bacterium]